MMSVTRTRLHTGTSVCISLALSHTMKSFTQTTHHEGLSAHTFCHQSCTSCPLHRSKFEHRAYLLASCLSCTPKGSLTYVPYRHIRTHIPIYSKHHYVLFTRSHVHVSAHIPLLAAIHLDFVSICSHTSIFMHIFRHFPYIKW